MQRTTFNKTGGGTNYSTLLAAEEEKALSLLGKRASYGICGGIGMH